MRRALSGGLAMVALAVAAAQVAAPAGHAAPAPETSAATLSALSGDIFAELNGPAGIGAGLSYAGVDSKANRVEIGVVKPTVALIARLERQYGKDRIRVVQAPIFQTTQLVTDTPVLTPAASPDGAATQAFGACTSEGYYCAPTRGGILLQQERDGRWYSCTSTNVGSSRSGQRATLTAGHCFTSGNDVAYGTLDFSGRAAGGWLGAPGDRLFGGTSDHLVIPWSRNTGWYGRDNPTNCLFTVPDNCIRMNFNAGTDDIGAGTGISQRGVTSQGNRNGTVVLTSTTANIGNPETGTVTTVTDMVQTNACSLPGDSGGPTWTGDRLVGTISAGNFVAGDPPQCAAQPRTFVAKATNAYYNLGFSGRLSP
ncbi:trypsin-like serine protease [Actinomycetes bacterium KLBMP 9797]